MNLTQPAATKTLAELEELIGDRLFVRTARGLVATVLGEAATRYARLVFKDLEALDEELEALRAGGVGTVRIGAMNSQNGTLLPRAIAILKRDHPHIDPIVVEETSDRLLEALEEDELDLVVARIPQSWPTDRLDFRTFGEEYITVVARAGHPLADGRPVRHEALVDATWIIQLNRAPLRGIWEQIFREARLPLPRNVVETSSTLLTVSLIERTDMLALLPQSTAFAALNTRLASCVALSQVVPPSDQAETALPGGLDVAALFAVYTQAQDAIAEKRKKLAKVALLVQQ